MKKGNTMKTVTLLLVFAVTLSLMGCSNSPERYRQEARKYVDTVVFQTNPTDNASDCIILGYNKDCPKTMLLIFMSTPTMEFPRVTNVVEYNTETGNVKFVVLKSPMM